MPGGFTLQGTQQLKAALNKAGPLATQALASAMVTEMESVIAKARELVPANTGALKGSGTVLPPNIQGTRIEVQGGFGNAASKYAIWVHEGRSKGAKMPPVDAIKQWLHDKGMDEGAAFIVARAIARRGLPRPGGKGFKFLERPFLESEPGMPARLAASIAVALERLRVP